MKRTISVLLAVLLFISAATLLAACGSIDNAEKWQEAMEAFKTANAVTIKIEDNNKMVNQLANKERLLSTVEVSFDAEKGMAHVNVDYTRRNFWETDIGVGAYEIYYVIDGENVISYRKNLRTQQWEEPQTVELNDSAAAESYLRERYLKPTDPDGNDFPIFTQLKYNDFKADLFGNYEWKPTDSRFKYTYTLNFASGKPSKFTYQHKTSAGNVDNTRKFSMTIEYSADITVPADLPNS